MKAGRMAAGINEKSSLARSLIFIFFEKAIKDPRIDIVPTINKKMTVQK